MKGTAGHHASNCMLLPRAAPGPQEVASPNQKEVERSNPPGNQEGEGQPDMNEHWAWQESGRKRKPNLGQVSSEMLIRHLSGDIK